MLTSLDTSELYLVVASINCSVVYTGKQQQHRHGLFSCSIKLGVLTFKSRDVLPQVNHYSVQQHIKRTWLFSQGASATAPFVLVILCNFFCLNLGSRPTFRRAISRCLACIRYLINSLLISTRGTEYTGAIPVAKCTSP